MLKSAAAIVEIEQAVRAAFPAASEFVARADDTLEVLVKFHSRQKPVAVRFSADAFDAFRRREESARHQSLSALRLVCNFAFARDYDAANDAVIPFVIDANMALSNMLG